MSAPSSLPLRAPLHPGSAFVAAPAAAAGRGGPPAAAAQLPTHRQLLQQAMLTIEQAITTLKKQPGAAPSAPSTAPVSVGTAAALPAAVPISAVSSRRGSLQTQMTQTVADVSTNTEDEGAALSQSRRAFAPPPQQATSPAASRLISKSQQTAQRDEEEQKEDPFSHTIQPPVQFYQPSTHQPRIYSQRYPSASTSNSSFLQSPNTSIGSHASSYVPHSVDASLMTSFAHLFPARPAPSGPCFDEPVFSSQPPASMTASSSTAAGSWSKTMYVELLKQHRLQHPPPSPVSSQATTSVPSRPIVMGSTCAGSSSLSSFARTLQLQRQQLEQQDDSDEEAALRAHTAALRRPVTAPIVERVFSATPPPTRAASATSAFTAVAPVSSTSVSISSISSSVPVRPSVVDHPSVLLAARSAARVRMDEDEREDHEAHQRTLERLREALKQPVKARPMPSMDYAAMREKVRATEVHLEAHLREIASTSPSRAAPFTAARTTMAAAVSSFAPLAPRSVQPAASSASQLPRDRKPTDLDLKIQQTQQRAAKVLAEVDETLWRGRIREGDRAITHPTPVAYSASLASAHAATLGPSSSPSTWSRLQAELSREESEARAARAELRAAYAAEVRPTPGVGMVPPARELMSHFLSATHLAEEQTKDLREKRHSAQTTPERGPSRKGTPERVEANAHDIGSVSPLKSFSPVQSIFAQHSASASASVPPRRSDHDSPAAATARSDRIAPVPVREREKSSSPRPAVVSPAVVTRDQEATVPAAAIAVETPPTTVHAALADSPKSPVSSHVSRASEEVSEELIYDDDAISEALDQSFERIDAEAREEAREGAGSFEEQKDEQVEVHPIVITPEPIRPAATSNAAVPAAAVVPEHIPVTPELVDPEDSIEYHLSNSSVDKERNRPMVMDAAAAVVPIDSPVKTHAPQEVEDDDYAEDEIGEEIDESPVEVDAPSAHAPIASEEVVSPVLGSESPVIVSLRSPIVERAISPVKAASPVKVASPQFVAPADEEFDISYESEGGQTAVAPAAEAVEDDYDGEFAPEESSSLSTNPQPVLEHSPRKVTLAAEISPRKATPPITHQPPALTAAEEIEDEIVDEIEDEIRIEDEEAVSAPRAAARDSPIRVAERQRDEDEESDHADTLDVQSYEGEIRDADFDDVELAEHQAAEDDHERSLSPSTSQTEIEAPITAKHVETAAAVPVVESSPESSYDEEFPDASPPAPAVVAPAVGASPESTYDDEFPDESPIPATMTTSSRPLSTVPTPRDEEYVDVEDSIAEESIDQSLTQASMDEFPADDGEDSPVVTKPEEKAEAAPQAAVTQPVAEAASEIAATDAVTADPSATDATGEYAAQGYYDEHGQWIATDSSASQAYYDATSGQYYDPVTQTYWNESTQAWEYEPCPQAAPADDQPQQTLNEDGTIQPNAYDHTATDAQTAPAAAESDTAAPDADAHEEIEDELEVEPSHDVEEEEELVIEEQPRSADQSMEYSPRKKSSPLAAASLSPQSKSAAPPADSWAAQIASEQAAADALEAAKRVQEQLEEEKQRARKGKKRREIEEEEKQAAANKAAEEAESKRMAEAAAIRAQQQSEEDRLDAEIESRKAAQLAAEAEQDDFPEEDIEFTHEADEEADLSASAHAKRKKEEMVEAITMSLLKDLTRDSLAPSSSSSAAKDAKSTTPTYAEAEAKRVKEAKATAKTLAESAQSELQRRRSLTEPASVAAAHASPTALNTSSEIPEDDIVLEGGSHNLGGTSEFHINSAVSPSGSFDGGELINQSEAMLRSGQQRKLSDSSTSSAVTATTIGAKASSSSASSPALSGVTSPPLSSSTPPSDAGTDLMADASLPNSWTGTPTKSLSSHSSPTLSPRGSWHAKDDKAIAKIKHLELLGRARLADLVAERVHIPTAVDGKNKLIVEEQRGLQINPRSRGSSASNSPVVSPRMANRALLQRRNDDDPISPSRSGSGGFFDQVSPVSKLNLSALLGATTPSSNSPRVLASTSSSSSPRVVHPSSTSASSSPRVLSSAVRSSGVSHSSLADAVVDSLADEMLEGVRQEVEGVWKGREGRTDAAGTTTASSSAAVADLTSADDSYDMDLTSPSKGTSLSGAHADEAYEISHEDLSQPSPTSNHQRPSPSKPASSVDRIDLDTSIDDYTDDFLPDTTSKESLDGANATASMESKPSKLTGGLPQIGKPSASSSLPPVGKPKSSFVQPQPDPEEVYAEEEFDEFAALDARAEEHAKAKEKELQLQQQGQLPTIITQASFVRKYLREVLLMARSNPSAGDSTTASTRATIEAAGGHHLRVLPESLYVQVEREQSYFTVRSDDEPDLPRSFASPNNASDAPFPLESQQIFHKLLFDSLNESITYYHSYWTRQLREPWFRHRRVLGTGLDMATRAAAGGREESGDDEEGGIPRISTHMKQVSLEHGIALTSHSHLPSRSDETIEQLHSRLIERVVHTVEQMHGVTKKTPTLGAALTSAAAHVAALTAGPSNGQPPAANVKIPSTAQSVLEYEMNIVTTALHPATAESVSSPTGVSLLDLSCDSTLEWEQFEPRSAIALVEEIADHLFSELVISTVSVLRHMQAKRSSLNFAEAATAATKGRRAALQLR